MSAQCRSTRGGLHTTPVQASATVNTRFLFNLASFAARRVHASQLPLEIRFSAVCTRNLPSTRSTFPGRLYSSPEFQGTGRLWQTIHGIPPTFPLRRLREPCSAKSPCFPRNKQHPASFHARDAPVPPFRLVPSRFLRLRYRTDRIKTRGYLHHFAYVYIRAT